MSLLTKLFPAPPHTPEPSPGLHHYRRASGNERARIHLRLDPGGQGTLIVNSSRILHLNPTAALMAFLLLEEVPPTAAVRLIRQKYHVGQALATADLAEMEMQITELVRPDGACPVHDLSLDIQAPFSARPTAPYRLDLALTYHCNNDCAHCYNVEHPAPSDHPTELPTRDWITILDRAWQLGIPHIIFTGGEPTLRLDLPELIAHAEHNGQITGLNTNGRRLSDPAYVQRLLEAGLDHVQITLESSLPAIHDAMVAAKGAFRQTVHGLRNVLATPLYVMTNTTMLRPNLANLPALLDFTAELGVPTVGLNALIYSGRGASVGTGLHESELAALLHMATQKTTNAGQKLIWYTPTQYCNFDPVQMDLGVKGCTAALYNLCVEPDGGVLPCQSYYQPIGNFLHDPWANIWDHPLAVRLRERQGLPEKCNACLLISECGGGCPLQFEPAPLATIRTSQP